MQKCGNTEENYFEGDASWRTYYYQTSREDDHFGRLSTRDWNGRYPDRIFLPTLETLAVQSEPRPSRAVVVVPSIHRKINQAVIQQSRLTQMTEFESRHARWMTQPT
ncbi:hypothetical protein TNCV_1814001 [Trichonephila clavipes]|nr:hypothetical protein TNCV_1814001 [Trichonephila clavipes]